MNGIGHRVGIIRSRLVSTLVGLDRFVDLAKGVPGWVEPPASVEVALRSYRLPADATVVEIGCFQGRSTILLAGGRLLRGSGRVHVVDPFDCSGDAFSVPYYERALEASGASSLEAVFRDNVDRAGIAQLVDIHRGTSFDVIREWRRPIDLLLLDGDHSPDGQRRTFELWLPFLKSGGQFLMHNVGEREYAEGHDGSRLLELTEVRAPAFSQKTVIQYTLFATKA